MVCLKVFMVVFQEIEYCAMIFLKWFYNCFKWVQNTKNFCALLGSLTPRGFQKLFSIFSIVTLSSPLQHYIYILRGANFPKHLLGCPHPIIPWARCEKAYRMMMTMIWIHTGPPQQQQPSKEERGETQWSPKIYSGGFCYHCYGYWDHKKGEKRVKLRRKRSRGLVFFCDAL